MQRSQNIGLPIFSRDMNQLGPHPKSFFAEGRLALFFTCRSKLRSIPKRYHHFADICFNGAMPEREQKRNDCYHQPVTTIRCRCFWVKTNERKRGQSIFNMLHSCVSSRCFRVDTTSLFHSTIRAMALSKPLGLLILCLRQQIETFFLPSDRVSDRKEPDSTSTLRGKVGFLTLFRYKFRLTGICKNFIIQ